jgi:UDP-N-acetylglucosamine 2-epimerase (non-hydrolysing)
MVLLRVRRLLPPVHYFKKVVKLLFVFGTRPEAIKMAPVIQAARKAPDLDVRICVTGQHRGMLDQVLQFFCICPDHDLSVMQHNQDLSTVTARILEGLRPVLLAERPDLVIVQGDTVSALAASMASFFERIRVAHVEAGLRTHDLRSPFPEEAIRQMISRMTSLHFAATESNRQALLAEGVPPRAVFRTGNPVVDAVLWTRARVRTSRVNPLSEVLDRAVLQQLERASHVILVTAHRRENLGAGLREICAAVADLARHRGHAFFVFPVHPNPNVRNQVHSALESLENVFLAPPLEYPAFAYLMDKCSLIVSDSGGIQEEAAALGKPVVLTRTTTERTEAVDCGAVRLAGPDRDSIVRHVHALLDAAEAGHPSAPIVCPFGDGNAAEEIVAIIRRQAFYDAQPTISLQALAAALGNSITPQAEPETTSISLSPLG